MQNEEKDVIDIIVDIFGMAVMFFVGLCIGSLF